MSIWLFLSLIFITIVSSCQNDITHTLSFKGFHGLLKLQSKTPTILKIHFSSSFFIDLDEIYRLQKDKTSTLFTLNIKSSRYPINIEQPEWLENNFWIEFKISENLINFELEIPVHLRYHRAKYLNDNDEPFVNARPLDTKNPSFYYKIDCPNGQIIKPKLTGIKIPIGDMTNIERNFGIALGTIFLSSYIIIKGLF